MADIEITDEVYEALRLPEDERELVLRRELAVACYRQDILSFGKARELADMSSREFQRLLGRRGIERHYTDEELDDDIAYARE
ncbi:UPF0175 family protein [Natronomonas marina]|jgi:predicted HTH domain antitoxin|uniref:UPF0175 family protein n=1 Tax=Natronomonas marina TaxID=2961939 RepID=UPI0020C9CE15|nr:UPF0175 family protein [Natronomonas marina]